MNLKIKYGLQSTGSNSRPWDELNGKLGKWERMIHNLEVSSINPDMKKKMKKNVKNVYKPNQFTRYKIESMVASWNWESAAYYEMEKYFLKNLALHEIFHSLPLKKQFNLVQRVAESKNNQHYTGKVLKNRGAQHRHKIILQVSEKLKNSKRGSQISTDDINIKLKGDNRQLKRVSSKENSSHHSHAGRLHYHALPKQGKAHRHGNGAVGR